MPSSSTRLQERRFALLTPDAASKLARRSRSAIVDTDDRPAIAIEDPSLHEVSVNADVPDERPTFALISPATSGRRRSSFASRSTRLLFRTLAAPQRCR
jgi:hypothetical protein